MKKIIVNDFIKQNIKVCYAVIDLKFPPLCVEVKSFITLLVDNKIGKCCSLKVQSLFIDRHKGR